MLNAITKETADAVDGREQTVRGFRAYFRWVAQRHDEFMLLFGGSARHAEEFADQIRAITDEAAAAIAPLIAVDIDPEHRDTLAHGLVGLGERFDPDEIAREVSALAWAGLRAVNRPSPTADAVADGTTSANA